MLELSEEDAAPQREPDPVSDEVTSSRIGEWLVSLDAPGPDESSLAREPQAAAALPEDDEIFLPDKHGYRQVVFDSLAYKTLVSRLERRVRLAIPAEADGMMAIRQRILGRLRQKQHVSRHSESETFQMVLSATWDPIAFLRDQYEEGSGPPGELLGRVITLTGSMDDAQALPCSEYLSQTWPETGPHILAVVTASMQTDSNISSRSAEQQTPTFSPCLPTYLPLATDVRFLLVALPDRSKITVVSSIGIGHFLMLAEGTADSIAEVGEVVAWLLAAVRCSPVEDAMAYCTPRVKTLDRDSLSARYRCELEFEMCASYEAKDVGGRCWHGMFRNPVVVRGFPIPRRPRPNTGLEIPFHMAARLTDARRLHDFMGRFYLKGFSAMLAAVEVIGGMVLWHLYHNTAGGRISYLDANNNSPHAEGISTNVLRASRHVIGWCSHADYLAGMSRSFEIIKRFPSLTLG